MSFIKLGGLANISLPANCIFIRSSYGHFCIQTRSLLWILKTLWVVIPVEGVCTSPIQNSGCLDVWAQVRLLKFSRAYHSCHVFLCGSGITNIKQGPKTGKLVIGLLRASVLTYASPFFVQLFGRLMDNPALVNRNVASNNNWEKIIDSLKQSLEDNCCV